MASINNMRLNAFTLLCISALWCLSGFSLAATVEAKKNDVKVYAEPTNKSAVKAQLKKGQKIPSLERKGMFWEVKLQDGQSGYVSVLMVSRQAGDDSKLSDAIQNIVKDGRSSNDASTEARSRSTVMGVRGLAASDSSASAGNTRPNLRAVYDMEDRVVSDNRIQRLGQAVFKEIEYKSNHK